MKWSQLEKSLREHFEARIRSGETTKEKVENTIRRYQTEFETRQTQIKTRLAASKIDPDERFRRLILDPSTRTQAFNDYFWGQNHWLVEALKLLFELNEKKEEVSQE